MLFLHSAVVLLYRWTKAEEKKTFTQKAISKVFETLTLSVYIRLVIEAFFMVLLSASFEILRVEISSVWAGLSLTFAFFMFFFCTGTVFLSCVLWKKARDDSTHQYFEEFFGGLKELWR